jgi:exosortase B
MGARMDLTQLFKNKADWWVVAIGLLVLYVPTSMDLAESVWASSDQGHGPIVLALSVWMIVKQWPNMLAASETTHASSWGWVFFFVAMLSYALGRSQATFLFEVGSVIPALIGVLLLLRGVPALRPMAFALFFLIFMVPLPDSLVDAITQPMKLSVSYVAENMMRLAGYPVARTGVTLSVGPYQLLVADACAGLHTLFTLEALGLLYLNMVRHASVLRNIGLAVLIVPISFAANVTRVVVLCLITYHFGDEAGQGFLHGFAGMVLFLTALMLIITVDSMLRALTALTRKRVQA